MSGEGDKGRCMHSLLADRSWYSYGTSMVARHCGIRTRTELLAIARRIEERCRDKINFFTFNGVEYMGFESRRLDYERDKVAKTNHVERLIERGAYQR
jgi:hypothetical protein